MTISSKLHQLRRYSFDVFFKLLDTQVQPVVLYVAEIWGIEHSACIIEKLHSFATVSYTHLTLPTNIAV